MEPVVTVGLDGSPESMAAAHWAAGEAERRRVTLRLMHAWPMLAPEPVRAASEIDQNYWAKRLVHHAQAELQARHPGLLIVGNLFADDAQDALLKAAAESELTVLGSRGLTSSENYFLGSVSMAVVSRAARPVVLVRTEAREQDPPRRVVVALKLHGPCDDLLAFAFEAAAARGVPLQIVHGRSLPLHAHAPWGVDHDVAKEISKEAQKQQTKVLRPWREKFPGVEPVETIRLASPAEAVVRAAEGASLLVVGRRTHRLALAPRLGPVAHAALHHARCPVAVVPHD
ncbi:stress-inducible protein [Streptomyces sp. CB02130]|uniref:universal stress protein n=1 Tax=Streptomyces sp. CB02130 TaxID=1703934 RepID=UPI00093ECC91|nr:universal stress protein [Streptomyces sp. CB02130]OKJ18428.1 stress-inducible protein [Streptomyces sp. CB02130]